MYVERTSAAHSFFTGPPEIDIHRTCLCACARVPWPEQLRLGQCKFETRPGNESVIARQESVGIHKSP